MKSEEIVPMVKRFNQLLNEFPDAGRTIALKLSVEFDRYQLLEAVMFGSSVDDRSMWNIFTTAAAFKLNNVKK